MSLFSLHIGTSDELDERKRALLPIEKAKGEVRPHIRVPGGCYAVCIVDETDRILYGATNAAPREVYGNAAVRWRPPPKGTVCRASVWRQKEPAKVSGFEKFDAFLKTNCTKLREFSFSIV